MKFKFEIFFIILITTISCTKKTELDKAFSCNNSTSFSETKTIKDIKNNFKINVPTNWKTQLYYDDFQSDVFSADTTKQLTETYILDTSWKLGELELNKEFESKIISSTDMTVVNSKFEDIQEKPAFWYHLKGENKGYDYHVLHIFIKTTVDSYLEIKTSVYGNKNVEKRLCESIQLINTLEII